jgi:flavin reductase
MMSVAMKLPDDAPPLSKEAFREGMSRLGAAVNIITTDGPAGRAGFTASAVCSVTDSPPTLLVCLNRASSVYDRFNANQALCVNTLQPDHEALSRLFGGKVAMDERFAAAAWRVGVSGAPVLEDAAVSFDCRISSSADVGSHTVLFCEVLAVECHPIASGLIYFDRTYHRI